MGSIFIRIKQKVNYTRTIFMQAMGWIGAADGGMVGAAAASRPMGRAGSCR
jgi:hypothetical protein